MTLKNKHNIWSNNSGWVFYLLIDCDLGASGIIDMKIRHRLRPRVSCVLFFFCSILLCHLPVIISAAVVTLDSIEIFETHEWLLSKPTVYFQCKGENRTVLPDVKENHVSYSFKGEESWQPLTELPDKKCKRCGFYEKDPIKPDYVFDEWEFCSSDFTRPDRKYIHLKEKELNATFLCPECVVHVETAPKQSSNSKNDSKGMHWVLIVIISALVSTLFIAGLVCACKYRQRRKRQQEQARFLKLFEEGDDDIEDELGIGPLTNVI